MDNMERIDWGEYATWLVSKKVSPEHLNAHEYALRLFENGGGCTKVAMQSLIESESRNGSEASRVRNLRVAARFISAFLEQQGTKPQSPERILALELDDSRYAGAPGLDLDIDGPSPVEEPLLDLGLNTRATPTLSKPIPISPLVAESSEKPPNLQDSQHKTGRSICHCTNGPTKAVPVISALKVCGPVAPVLFFALFLLVGKNFALMIEFGALALFAIIATIRLHMKCDTCEESLDNDELPKEHKRSLLRNRIILGGITVVLIGLSLRSHGKWAEVRQIANMSDEEFEIELRNEHKKEVEAELGYELSDEEYDAYTEREEAEARREAEEIMGRKLTDEEYEDWF